MPEIGKATIKIVPDTSEFTEAREALNGHRADGFNFLCNVVGIIALVCSPAVVWAVYGWAF